MIRLLVIADDLTGALDTGVQFARQGISTRVTMDQNPDFNDQPANLEVLVVDTQSRHLPPREAASRVKKVVASAIKFGIEAFYKKTDSTLRGNIGAELEAALEASGHKALCFIPAFPKAGRFTRNGRHYVQDTPLHQTQFAQDPLEPLATSSVKEIIELQTEKKVLSLNLGKEGESIDNFYKDGVILVFDCEGSPDIERIGKALKSSDLLDMTAGSAGFAEILPALLELQPSTRIPVNPAPPLLIINGSLNQVSRDQVRYARENGLKTCLVTQKMLAGISSPEITKLLEEVAGESASGRDVLISTSLEADPENLSPSPTDPGQAAKHPYLRFSRDLGRLTAEIIRNSYFQTLVVFGGDTLVGILDHLGISSISPDDEICPGIVISRIFRETGSLTLVTKAGGFGAKDAIMEIINYSRGRNK